MGARGGGREEGVAVGRENVEGSMPGKGDDEGGREAQEGGQGRSVVGGESKAEGGEEGVGGGGEERREGSR